ncbi:ECF transporter S component [Clostridium sp. DL1XJH146]
MEKRMSSKTSSKFGTRQIVVIGMLSSISIVLGITGLGFIPIYPVKATIMHIPVIIGAVIEGPVVGAMVGLIFGIFSIFQAISNPTILSYIFMNPLVSVLPRVLIGIIAYYIYKIIPVKNEGIKAGIAGAIGTLVNTVGVLTMMYLLYGASYAETIGIDTALAGKTIIGIGVANGIPEVIIATLITSAVVVAIKKIRK